MSTLRGAAVLQWVLGVRDRHKDNVMLGTHGEYVLIDFGHMFDAGPPLDVAVGSLHASVKEVRPSPDLAPHRA